MQIIQLQDKEISTLIFLLRAQLLILLTKEEIEVFRITQDKGIRLTIRIASQILIPIDQASLATQALLETHSWMTISLNKRSLLQKTLEKSASTTNRDIRDRM